MCSFHYMYVMHPTPLHPLSMQPCLVLILPPYCAVVAPRSHLNPYYFTIVSCTRPLSNILRRTPSICLHPIVGLFPLASLLYPDFPLVAACINARGRKLLGASSSPADAAAAVAAAAAAVGLCVLAQCPPTSYH